MPSSATPSSLDQLAGIAIQRTEWVVQRRTSFGWDGEACFPEDYYAMTEIPAEERARSRFAGYVDAYRGTAVAFRLVKREITETPVLLTPDSPRQAGEEITDDR